MAGDVNRVTLLGRLGKDPEVKHTQGGQSVANFSIATSESWTDKQGQKQEKTEWHRIVVWGKLADVVGKYCTKGKQVYLEGKITTRKWQDKEGKDHYTTEIVCHELKLLGGGDQAGRREEPPVGEPPRGGGRDSDAGMGPDDLIL